MKDYPPKMAVTADIAVVSKESGKWSVLLIKRKNKPFQGTWALPGGFTELPESVEETAKRELQEETGVMATELTLFGGYSKPDRDPRGRTVTFAYYIEVKKKSDVKVLAGDDAKEAEWHDLSSPPLLAFDHSEILEDLKTALENPSWRQKAIFK